MFYYGLCIIAEGGLGEAIAGAGWGVRFSQGGLFQDGRHVGTRTVLSMERKGCEVTDFDAQQIVRRVSLVDGGWRTTGGGVRPDIAVPVVEQKRHLVRGAERLSGIADSDLNGLHKGIKVERFCAAVDGEQEGLSGEGEVGRRRRGRLSGNVDHG